MSSDDKEKEKEEVCNRPDCIWVPTTPDPDFYVCLRCNKQRKVEKKEEEKEEEEGSELSPGLVLMGLIVALFISLIFSSTESQHQPNYRHYDPWSHRY